MGESELLAKLHAAIFDELGEPEYKLARWNQSSEPWHYWSREAIEAALAVAVRKVADSRASESHPKRKIMSDWSDLPADIYVTSATSIDGIGYEVQCCSVPMMLVPEVRYVRADAALRVAEGG
jgi:hypothetical protein